MIILYSVLIDQIIEVALELQERAFIQHTVLPHAIKFPYDYLAKYEQFLEADLIIAKDLLRIINLNFNSPKNSSETYLQFLVDYPIGSSYNDQMPSDQLNIKQAMQKFIILYDKKFIKFTSFLDHVNVTYGPKNTYDFGKRLIAERKQRILVFIDLSQEQVQDLIYAVRLFIDQVNIDAYISIVAKGCDTYRTGWSTVS